MTAKQTIVFNNGDTNNHSLNMLADKDYRNVFIKKLIDSLPYPIDKTLIDLDNINQFNISINKNGLLTVSVENDNPVQIAETTSVSSSSLLEALCETLRNYFTIDGIKEPLHLNYSIKISRDEKKLLKEIVEYLLKPYFNLDPRYKVIPESFAEITSDVLAYTYEDRIQVVLTNESGTDRLVYTFGEDELAKARASLTEDEKYWKQECDRVDALRRAIDAHFTYHTLATIDKPDDGPELSSMSFVVSRCTRSTVAEFLTMVGIHFGVPNMKQWITEHIDRIESLVFTIFRNGDDLVFTVSGRYEARTLAEGTTYAFHKPTKKTPFKEHLFKWAESQRNKLS
jgi:hypothetical protein